VKGVCRVCPDGGRPLQSRGCVGILLRGRVRKDAANKVAPQTVVCPCSRKGKDGRFFIPENREEDATYGHSNRWKARRGSPRKSEEWSIRR
jgi:hypothetical protein